jgi:hypothetical protein
MPVVDHRIPRVFDYARFVVALALTGRRDLVTAAARPSTAPNIAETAAAIARRMFVGPPVGSGVAAAIGRAELLGGLEVWAGRVAVDPDDGVVLLHRRIAGQNAAAICVRLRQ